jgi:hypothetical protein
VTFEHLLFASQNPDALEAMKHGADVDVLRAQSMAMAAAEASSSSVALGREKSNPPPPSSLPPYAFHIVPNGDVVSDVNALPLTAAAAVLQPFPAAPERVPEFESPSLAAVSVSQLPPHVGVVDGYNGCLLASVQTPQETELAPSCMVSRNSLDYG